MAIHTKVGILTHVPGSSASVTPGLIDGLYADFLTKDFDFLDDIRYYPQDAWFTNDPWEYTNHATGDWEDLATIYRGWRDEYNKESNEYWLKRSVRAPFQYKNFVKDTSGYDNPIEYIRLVYPAPNGEFNLPYPNPKWSDGYSYHNSSYPLRHNMTRMTLPLIDLTFGASYASGISDVLEPSSYVRDNQAAINAKQVEVDSLTISSQQAIDAYYAKSDEVQNLINSGADQSLIDAAQAELDILDTSNLLIKDQKNTALAELQTLQDASQWVRPDTMSQRNTDYRANRDLYFKLMNEIAISGNRSESLTQMSLTEEDFVIIKDKFLNHDFSVDNPNPWNDERFSFVWGDGQNPVEGAQNGTIHNGWLAGSDGNNTMTNHPLGTLPSEVLPGVTSINWLPAVLNTSLLPAIGNPGDVIKVINDLQNNDDDSFVAWDPQNAEWSSGFYYRFLDVFISRMDHILYAKLKAKNEMALAMKPFLFAAFHIPSLSLTTSDGNEVKNFSKPVSAE